MNGDLMDSEDCLSSLTAEALRHAHPDRPLFPSSLGLMAVANAFVMLGLLPEPRGRGHLGGTPGRAGAPRLRDHLGGHQG